MGVDVGVIAHSDDFFSDRIQCAQDIKTLSSGRCFNKDACKAPENSQKSAENKMGRIDKVNNKFSCFCVLKQRF